jgi:hypothetical protein
MFKLLKNKKSSVLITLENENKELRNQMRHLKGENLERIAKIEEQIKSKGIAISEYK